MIFINVKNLIDFFIIHAHNLKNSLARNYNVQKFKHFKLTLTECFEISVFN